MYVTDTHPLIWYAAENYKKLSKKARNVFQSAAEGKTGIYVPTVVFWEISLVIKSNPDEFELGGSFSGFIDRILSVKTFIEVPVSNSIIKISHELQFHKDPFDTLIVATAIELGLPLITNDRIIHEKEPCELFWD